MTLLLVLARRWLALGVFGLVFAATFTLASTAHAQRRAGTVRVTTPAGGAGPLVLRREGDAFTGELVIVNDGKVPLVVSRLALRGDASDPRVPPKLAARLLDGSLPVSLAPGASRRAIVQWTPEPGIRQRQLFGHVVVTTSDEASGDVAMGIRAQIPGWLGPLESHVLSLLLFIPFFAAALTIGMRAFGVRDDRTPHLVTVGALAAQALVAMYLYRGFVPDVSRSDGNDGLQFVQHVVWLRPLSVEIYLGVDGIGVTALLVTSVVILLAVVPERTLPAGAAGYHAALLVLDAAALGAIASMDGVVFVLFAGLAVGAATLLIGGWGEGARREAALRLALAGGAAVLLLAIAVFLAGRHAEPGFLVDGTKVTTTFNLPELSRVALSTRLAKICFVLVLLASLALLAAFPFHGWLSDVLATAPPATGILVASALPAVGLCAFLRIGCSVLPEAMRWASGIVVALGAITAAYGALSALGQLDLRRLAAAAATTQAGFVLLGAGSLTPQGLSGAIASGSTRAASGAVFLLLVSAVHERARTSDTSRLAGIASQMPGWAAALAVAAFAQSAVLGSSGAWGPVLALLGVLSSYAPLAIASAIALVVLAAAHLGALSRIAFGRLDPAWEGSTLLEAHGGRFPELTPREWTSVLPLVLLVGLLALWPAPVVGITTGTVRDLANAVSPPGPDQVAAR